MKVCILSMQRVCNFGSLLQAYALKRMLEGIGAAVAFLDIEPNREDDLLLKGKNDCFAEETGRSENILSKLKKVDRYAVNRFRIKFRAKQQERYFEEFRRAALGMDKAAGTERYDCCVIGSDEVFNCLSGAPWGFTGQLFGDVPQAERVITYAASCGATVSENVPEQVLKRIGEAFRNISAFSVRDENTHRFTVQLTEKDVQMHPDPAFVYDFTEELRKTELPAGLPERYCVVYSYYNRIHDAHDIACIKQFCKKHHMKIVSVGAPQMWIKNHLVLTPFETLKVFENAAFVITDTFHGTIFAAKYAKRFATMTRSSNENKLRHLIEMLQLEKHTVGSFEELEQLMALQNDTDRIAELAEAEKRRTLQYLKNHIF